MNTPKIVFKSDIPEDALNSLAAVFIEQIEKLLETEEGKAEFEKFMKEHSDPNKEWQKTGSADVTVGAAWNFSSAKYFAEIHENRFSIKRI